MKIKTINNKQNNLEFKYHKIKRQNLNIFFCGEHKSRKTISAALLGTFLNIRQFNH